MNRAYLAVASCVLICILPQTVLAQDTWNGGGTDGNWGTGANWVGGVAPINNTNLIFSGATRQNNTNNMNGSAGITNGWVQFNPSSGGFTLNGNLLGLNSAVGGELTNSAGTNIFALPISVVANNKTWSIASGSEVQFAGAVSNAAGANPLAIIVGGGTVRITSSGNVQSTRWFTINNGTVAIDAGNVNVSNDGFRLQPLASGQTAAFNVINNGIVKLAGSGSLRLAPAGSASGGIVSVNVSSGKFELDPTAGGSSPAYTGCISIGETAGVTTTITQSGGLVWLNPVSFSSDIKSLNLIYNTAGGTYNLNGGILMVRQITNALATVSSAIFNFNGGTLTPSSPTLSGTAFIPNTITANVQSGGAIIDSTNIDIAIAQNLVAGSPSGGLTKLGTSTLTMSGANTYTGNTTVSNGTLLVSTAGSLSGASAVIVKDGASFGVTNATAGGSVLISSLTEGVSTGGGLKFNFGANAPSSTIAPLQVTNLTANATMAVSVTGSAFVAGQFPLVAFTNVTGLANFQLGTLPLGVTGTLVTSANLISLNISSVAKQITWSGSASGLWDTGSINWKDLNNANNPTNYAQPGGLGDQVTFDDTLTANPSINVTLTVTPVSFTVSNNTTSYSFTGSGKVSGTVGLAKNGTNSLTVGTTNDYSGGTTLNAGRIRLGDDNALGSGLVILSGGALSSDGATARTLANPLKITIATTLGDATDSGTLTNNGGVDFNGAGRALTLNSDVVFANGATNGRVGTKQGSGTLTLKGLVDWNGASDVTAGTLIVDGANMTNTDRFIPDATAGNLAHLVITNGASVVTTGSNNNMRSGRAGAATGTNIYDLAGLFSPINAVLPDGNVTLYGGCAYSEMTFWPGGDFSARGVTNTGGAGNTVFKFNGGILRARNDNANFFEGLSQTLVQAGGAKIDDGGFAITINQALLDGGGGGLTKSGVGTLALTGANTYTGSTVISNGTMQLTGTGSIANSASIAVNGAATFDVSGLSSTFALGSGQVLSNLTATGIINGNANTASGTVGLTYLTGTPSLAVANGTLTLSASTTFNVNNTGSALASGGYKIIATNVAGLVAGTLPSVTVGGSGVAAGQHASLKIVNSELYLIVTNHAPVVASIVTNNVVSGLNWKIAITDLKTAAGWSDADGDTVTFSGASGTSFNGTNVSSDANYIYYNGAVTAEDHFTYTVTDGNMTANGTVYLEAAAAIAPSISNPTTDGSGHPTFSGSGIPGYTYGVESATSLSGPWVNAGTVTAASDGSWNFTDAGQTNPPVIFYRLYYPYSAGSPPQ